MEKRRRCRPDTKSSEKKRPLPHYVTPVQRQVRTPAKKVDPICTPLRIITLQPNRSLSLQDLSPSFQENLAIRRSLICREELPRVLPLTGCSSDAQTKILALVVLCRFRRMVCRKKKEVLDISLSQLHSSQCQVKSLKSQVESLKSLLNSDEQIISSSFREVQSLKAALADLEAKYRLALEEKGELESRAQRLKEDLLKTEAEASNCKNNLILVKGEEAQLEGKLQKEKEKSSRLKKENKCLLAKVENLANNLQRKTLDVVVAEEKKACLEAQLNVQLKVLKESEVKVEESDRSLEMVQKQLEIVHMRMKEERLALQVLVQKERLRNKMLVSELALCKDPPFKTKIIRLTEWFISLPLSMVSW